MSGSIAKYLPNNMELLRDPQMMRRLANETVIAIGGRDEMKAWAKRSDDNQGKLYALAARLAPKEVAVSGTIGIEAYIDAIEAAGGNQAVIDGEFEVVNLVEAKVESGLFLWPDCFFIDLLDLPAHT